MHLEAVSRDSLQRELRPLQARRRELDVAALIAARAAPALDHLAGPQADRRKAQRRAARMAARLVHTGAPDGGQLYCLVG